MIEFEFLHPGMTYQHLGYLPDFFDRADPRPAREQVDEKYVSGWRPFPGFRLDAMNVLHYPGDPPLRPLAQARLRDELIVFYQSSWVAIIQPDRSYEVCRVD